jgi:tetratricopeptide (TPR) repeat protein
MTTARALVTDLRTIRLAGLVLSIAYAWVIVWLFVNQPRTIAEIGGGLASTVGAYRIDQAAFKQALDLFRADRFEEARAGFERADPAHRDPVTQFYIAYSYYRQGWGRVYHDDKLYRQGLQALDRAVALSPDGRIVVDDANLGLHTSDDLRAEFQHGLTRELADFNPMRVFRERK